MKVLSFIFLIGISIVPLAKSDKKYCKSYSCFDKIELEKSNKNCSSKSKEGFVFGKCNKNYYCPYLSMDNAVCEKIDTRVMKYLGGNCNNNSDCINDNICEDGYCIKKNISLNCETHSDCHIGFFCGFESYSLLDYAKKDSKSKKICLEQLNERSLCFTDYDCINTHGCLNGECIEYFSKEDGFYIGKLYYQQGIYSFCKSTFLYQDKCTSTALRDDLIDKVCDISTIYGEENLEKVKCVYFYKKEDSKKSIKIEYITELHNENCNCGFNENGYSYCKPGTQDKIEEINEFKSILKRFLENKFCHTLERKFCSYIFENDIVLYRKLEKSIHFTFNNHLIKNTEKCIRKIIFPMIYNKGEIKSCPKYSCLSSNEIFKKSGVENTCIYEDEGEFDETKEVYFSECKYNEKCIYSKYEISLNYDGNYTAICKKKNNNLSFPGEPCNSDEDCREIDYFSEKNGFEKLKNCKFGLCEGNKEGKQCISNQDCVAGTYCKLKENGKSFCQKQKDKYQDCREIYDCKNEFICFNGVCVDYFSLEVGEQIGFLEKRYQKYACKSGFFQDGKCSRLAYLDNSKSNYGIIDCRINETCNYKYYNTKAIRGENIDLEKILKEGVDISIPCTCGYNSYRNGYCKIDTENKFNSDKINSFIDFRKAMFANNCHTRNRLCSNFKEDELIAKTNNIDIMMFNSVGCAKNVLSNLVNSIHLSLIKLCIVSLLVIN